jgi:hypothetical protein
MAGHESQRAMQQAEARAAAMCGGGATEEGTLPNPHHTHA